MILTPEAKVRLAWFSLLLTLATLGCVSSTASTATEMVASPPVPENTPISTEVLYFPPSAIPTLTPELPPTPDIFDELSQEYADGSVITLNDGSIVTTITGMYLPDSGYHHKIAQQKYKGSLEISYTDLMNYWNSEYLTGSYSILAELLGPSKQPDGQGAIIDALLRREEAIGKKIILFFGDGTYKTYSIQEVLLYQYAGQNEITAYYQNLKDRSIYTDNQLFYQVYGRSKLHGQFAIIQLCGMTEEEYINSQKGNEVVATERVFYVATIDE